MKLLVLPLTCLLTACVVGKPEFETATTSAAPASKIDWLGNETRLLGDGDLAEGKALPVTTVVNERMKEESLGGAGRVRLISVVPSLDTEICDRQTHLLSESKRIAGNVERITISRDLPYAQGRFAEKAGLENLKYVSDYRSGEFGKKLGLVIERNQLLARALIVVDKNGVVRHLQITSKIYTLPNVENAIEVANRLSKEM